MEPMFLTCSPRCRWMTLLLVAFYASTFHLGTGQKQPAGSASPTSPESLGWLQAAFSSLLLSASNSSSTSSLVQVLQQQQQHEGVEASLEARAVSTCVTGLSEDEVQGGGVERCLMEKQCFAMADVAGLYRMNEPRPLTPSQVTSICPALLYSLVSCHQAKLDQKLEAEATPSSKAAWGYSILFVTLINLCSLMGALVLPCMKLKNYKVILMFMVALAVGTLAGSGLLFLIPDAFGFVHDNDTGYIWKSTTIMGGVYLFYLLEKLMRAINQRNENTKQKKRQDEKATEGLIITSFRRKPIDNSLPEKDLSTLPSDLGAGICPVSSLEAVRSYDDGDGFDKFSNSSSKERLSSGDMHSVDVSISSNHSHCSNGKAHHHHHPSQKDGPSPGQVAPVAYMIIFGDALHNFIDGLSIGSAFTQSIMTGISVSMAVFCEELPHELGDFAILLNSGMQFRKALMYNFLSATTCYLGTIIGIMLGENTSSHEWIFALAGGMFLYISLVDMLPEMNAASETKEGKELGGLKVFLIHNLGLLSGYGLMVVMALYATNITFA